MGDKLTYDAYCEWHLKTFGEDLRSSELGVKFDANTVNLQNAVNAHAFMPELTRRLAEKASEGVFERTGKSPDIILHRKPFASLADKLFRTNCLWNRRWPDEPKLGWVQYKDSFARIDDIIRTTLITKYLDGPEIVSRQITEAAEFTNLKARSSPRATDAGYYAWHSYVSFPVQIIVEDKVIEIEIETEFQSTTLLQSSLRELTHKFYEESRQSVNADRASTRWDYNSHKFRGEYLGHTLHLVDAMILELRNAQNVSPIGAALLDVNNINPESETN